MHLSAEELLGWTDEERTRWEQWFVTNGEELLEMPLSGTKETTVGALIMHIFGPEIRYVQRLRNEPVLEYRHLPATKVSQVFGFGLETRKAMREFVDQAKTEDWSRVVEYDVADYHVRATTRKIILHTLMHEVRHWAQIARMMRERGFVPPGDHDLLMSGAIE